MKITPNHRDLALLYHRRLPIRIKIYLNAKGISDPIIHRYRLGWDGYRITIPITNRDRHVTFFQLAKDPDDCTGEGAVISSRGAYPEIYGWERLSSKREQLVICESEFDRLVLEAQDIPAIALVGGDGQFIEEWVKAFGHVQNLFACFHNKDSSTVRAGRIAATISGCRVVHLPRGVGEDGTISDFFTILGMGRQDFLTLLESAGSGEAAPTVSSSLP